ncbi:Gfo/Idh/MocA family protein [Puniceibacterium sp. IMCC21224]|uniref:Gfo/Idh/MocA family protein n=1 Tax=Puniceibacterium sp. IMCC21224 TaxID=1618204 RepID=UPI00064D83CE|nr:Gfo/Idh/MocA family oxidoreductase [Puniceibacterium sp. IMCC21224]KMK65651.1 putative dehydrogenase [Puniceibacterium sp. IMCC21224]
MSNGSLSIIGCGFVADLYMRSLAAHPELQVVQVWDHDAERLKVFCDHWKIAAAPSLNALLDAHPKDGVVLNLTNPRAHFEINKAALEVCCHVYCEKPLALTLKQAKALHSLADEKGLMLASAPCSALGEAAQTLGHALRNGMVGRPRVIYAELDDGYIAQAAYEKWLSETGAPWPYEDEFQVGCTLEHAGYYLTWLMAWFGPVRRVVAASAECIDEKQGRGPMAPDLSVATLFFADGPVVRLTCSIIAPHDHGIRIVGDKGVLWCKAAWDNSAKVRFARRLRIRRRLLEHPLPRRVRLPGPTHPKVGRWGAAAMNFMLGPAEMVEALAQGRPPRLSNDLALHLTEVTLAIQNAGDDTGAQQMTTTCKAMEPMPWAK